MIRTKGKKPRQMPGRPSGLRRRRNAVRRTEPKGKPPSSPAIPEPVPAEEVKEVRMRLDTNDRRLDRKSVV